MHFVVSELSRKSHQSTTKVTIEPCNIKCGLVLGPAYVLFISEVRQTCILYLSLYSLNELWYGIFRLIWPKIVNKHLAGWYILLARPMVAFNTLTTVVIISD